MMRELAPGVWLASGTHVNFLVLVEGTAVTLVDAGWAGDTQRVIAALAHIGRAPQDVQAIVITHAHIDHVGGVAEFHNSYGTPVFAHPDEIAHAHGDVHEQASVLDIVPSAWRPRTLRWATAVARVGALKHVELPFAKPFVADGTPLDLPGAPLPVACPGHTSGHCGFLLAGGVLATGDALVTGHPLSARSGPQLLPEFFSADPQRTAATLDALAATNATVIAPGHGPAFFGSVASAVSLARRDTSRHDSGSQ